MIPTLTRPKMIPLLRMETLKNHTLLGGTYLSHWRMQTFRRERGGGGGGHPKPLIRGGGRGWSQKMFFRPYGPQFVLRIRGWWWWWGGGAPLDPPLYLAHIWEYPGI